MNEKCSKCGEQLEGKSEFCIACGQRVEHVVSHRYYSYSKASLIIGCIAMAIFWWFPMFLIDDLYDVFTKYGALTIILLFILITIGGIVIGGISVKKGKKLFAILGIVFNLVPLAFQAYHLEMLIFIHFQ
ncbi:MAG: zinc ribbon domain-containing protein [Candidatus Heimdallarchaeota archaeon]|nr:zinc ribbon domain-containing protein [Candidatus Heimdallarchaeota archaeon]